MDSARTRMVSTPPARQVDILHKSSRNLPGALDRPTPAVRPTHHRRMGQSEPMGDDIASRTFTREDRQRYRDKVHRCLDVFARMLAESRFDFETPMTGMEVELNLIEADG